MGLTRTPSTMAEVEKLPEDLLSFVLSLLPFPWVVQARLVCRRWLNLLTSQPFAMLWASRPWQGSMWLLLHHGHATQNTSLSAFHLSSQLRVRLTLDLHPPPLSSSILASCHVGLLVSSCHGRLLSLVNPLTRQSLRLPPPRGIRSVVHAGVAPLGSSQTDFQIIVLGLSDLPDHPALLAQLYNSMDASWASLPQPPPPPPPRRAASIPPRSAQSFVWWNNAFCILSSNRVLTFNPRQPKLWGSISFPSQPRIWDQRYFTLHVIRHRLFLEGNFQEQGDFQRRFPLRVGILELDSTSLEWKEVGLMPDKLSQSLCKEPHPAHCFYTAYSDPHCESICFAPFTTGAPDTEAEEEVVLVLYHVKGKCWTSMRVFQRTGEFGSPSFKGLTFHTPSS